MDEEVIEKIRNLLRAEGVDFKEVQHEPVYTSEQAAQARGEELRIGGKALLMKAGDSFKLLVISGALRIDSSAVRRYLGQKRIRFATPEELAELTGLVPGSVPPFGPPVLPFDLYADPSVLVNDRIAFNAGSLTRSIVLSSKDYIKAAKPEIFEFAEGS